MTITSAPPREDLVAKASALVPLLRRNAEAAAAGRRLTEDTVEALADAGILRMRVPARFGGYEVDARTLNAVLVELGRGDAAVAWTMSVWTIPGWMVGMFPEEVQQEVYATRDVRVCGTLSPTGTARPADGGVVVNGRWSFISGAPHSHWQEVIAMAPTPDGAGMWPIMALVPMADLRIVDDWHSSGLRGSGSVTTVAEEVFVPAARVLPMADVVQARSASPLSAELPMYRTPLLGVANASTVGTLVGMAQAAHEVFFERLGDRRIAFTDYDQQSSATVTHLQVAEATMRIDEAAFHAERCAARVDAKGAAGEEWSLQERARSRAEVGAVCHLGKAAVDLLGSASGGSSVYESVPIQRIVRDFHAISLHGLITPSTNYELYGRVLCGLEPNTTYI